MHREILQACLPCLIALAVSFLLLRLTVRLSGVRFGWKLAWRRLRGLHGCEHGGVQSLAFVLTLPFFIVICMFIVQVSQLMLGVMTVHYSAFAAARAASVWAPARAYRTNGDLLDENKMGEGMQNGVPVLLTSQSSFVRENAKYRKIFEAAALGCAPISPSRDLGFQLDDLNQRTAASMKQVYSALVPSSQSNSRIPFRIDAKLAYSYANTVVRIEFFDKDTFPGPTYNPRAVVRDPESGDVVEDGSGNVVREWDPNEVGWQDPIQVVVTHEFALLPGPGRFLAKYLVRQDGRPDRVPDRIDQSTSPSREKLYTTSITASATMTNEGFKSLVPYAQVSY